MSGNDDGFGMNDGPATGLPPEAAQARDREIAQAEQRAAPNPETHRMIEGKSETFVIPRDQQGQPLTEYFQNAKLPEDLSKAVVYQTDKGPVLGKPDPVKWDHTHDAKARDYADRIKAQIDDHGFYSKPLNSFASRLSSETGIDQSETRAMIVKQFELKHGQDPYRYLANIRQQQGLPVRDQQRPEQTRAHKQGR